MASLRRGSLSKVSEAPDVKASDTDSKRPGPGGTEGIWEREDVPDKVGLQGCHPVPGEEKPGLRPSAS